ncbi:MAG: cell division topological specificity factor MinE [Gammaproteobacteria bacterium]|nr:cell division topological specificity factor MinE [Gammaproteobacteria bacterium]
MGIFTYLRGKKTTSTASLAKERLQIVIAHERSHRHQPEFLPQMKQELLQVVRKYVHIKDDDIAFHFDNQDDCNILELNITMNQD